MWSYGNITRAWKLCSVACSSWKSSLVWKDCIVWEMENRMVELSGLLELTPIASTTYPRCLLDCAFWKLIMHIRASSFHQVRDCQCPSCTVSDLTSHARRWKVMDQPPGPNWTALCIVVILWKVQAVQLKCILYMFYLTDPSEMFLSMLPPVRFSLLMKLFSSVSVVKI